MPRIILALVAMAVCSTTAHAQKSVRGLDLVNHSHGTVASFYASHAGNDRWDGDLLRRHHLLPNHFVQLDLDDPSGSCRFDLKVVFADGSSTVRRAVDVCKQGTFKVTD